MSLDLSKLSFPISFATWPGGSASQFLHDYQWESPPAAESHLMPDPPFSHGLEVLTQLLHPILHASIQILTEDEPTWYFGSYFKAGEVEKLSVTNSKQMRTDSRTKLLIKQEICLSRSIC